MSTKDSIYSQALDSIADFSFDDSVASVFPDMIRRSVPGYSTIIAMTGVIANRYAQAGSNCYDLGCSLGASTLSMRRQIAEINCKIIAVDNSDAMLKRCQTVILSDENNSKSATEKTASRELTGIELVLADIREATIENASVVVLNFTLQFIPPEQRRVFLQTVYNGMNEGGVLILSEKFKFGDQHLQQLNTDLHHAFKSANGYSDMEISQKRTAIENVLMPETMNTHQTRLKEIGFTSVDVWFQCFNFASIVAVK